jgi:hypothetical protein
VTEAEWLACTDPEPMLEYLRGKASGRKLRLFACACVRRIWTLLPTEECRKAAQVAERYADRLADAEELRAAYTEAYFAGVAPDYANSVVVGELALYAEQQLAGHTDPWESAFGSSDYVREAVGGAPGPDSQEREAQCHLLRDIFGPPLFHSVTFSPVWETPQVVALAQAAYDNRALPAGTLDPARLAVLADALEDAGCDQADLLGHLRGAGPHVRGCWAVDLLLGKG